MIPVLSDVSDYCMNIRLIISSLQYGPPIGSFSNNMIYVEFMNEILRPRTWSEFVENLRSDWASVVISGYLKKLSILKEFSGENGTEYMIEVDMKKQTQKRRENENI